MSTNVGKEEEGRMVMIVSAQSRKLQHKLRSVASGKASPLSGRNLEGIKKQNHLIW